MKPLMICALTAVALTPASATSHAQAAATPANPAAAPMARWSAWLGCWTPNELRPPTRDIRLCVVPNAAQTGVRLITFAGEQIVSEESLVADGSREAMTERGCQGTREVRFARAGERLYSSSELRCEDKSVTPSAMISTLTSPNRWLDIQVTGPSGRQSVRTARYVRSTDEPPAAIARDLASLANRHGVSITPLTLDDVVEAAKLMPSPAVELWLAEVEPRLPINKATLTQLANARVSEPVIDLLVGLAYPNRFRVERVSAPGFLSADSGYVGPMFPVPFGTGAWMFMEPWVYPYSPFGLVAFEYGAWGSMYPYYPIGNSYPVSYGPGGGADTPIAASGRGRLVNGQGYTRVEPIPHATSSSSGSGTSGSSGGGYSTFSGPSGDSSASPAGYSSGGGGGGGGQTAIPR